jgi:hypothetical protein
MNFWKAFRWLFATLFIALMLLALVSGGNSNQAPDGNEPSPVPVFR